MIVLMETSVKPIQIQFLHTQFSLILLILFKHSSKIEGVQQFVLEKPSYIFVFGKIDHDFLQSQTSATPLTNKIAWQLNPRSLNIKRDYEK